MIAHLTIEKALIEAATSEDGVDSADCSEALFELARMRFAVAAAVDALERCPADPVARAALELLVAL